MNRKGVFVLVLLFFSILVGCGLTEGRIKREKEATAHYKFGVAYLRDNPPSIQQAYVEFQKALKLDPRHMDAHYALGHVHFRRENYLDAIASFKKVLSIDPNYSEAYNYLGKVYEVQGKLGKAVEAYQKALENKQYATPQLPHLNLGLLYLKQEKYDEARREFQNVLRFDSDNIVAHNELGKVYHLLGNQKEAIGSYQEAIRRAPAFLDAHYNLAFSYLKDGSKNLAAKEFKKVIELSPQSQQAKESEKFLDALQ
ncbi:MAG: tetratricopeptide repeat protein [Nitrospiria bacterium]